MHTRFLRIQFLEVLTTDDIQQSCKRGTTYWHDFSHWKRQENKRTADENLRREKDALAQEKRRKKAEYSRKWYARKAQEKQAAEEKLKERARRAAALAAFAEALRNAQEHAHKEQFRQEQQYTDSVIRWQQRANAMAKLAEVEARVRRVAEKALDERRKVAEKRLREQERQRALAAKLQEAAAVRAERERYEQQEFQKERQAQLEWILAHVEHEERERKKEQNKAHVKPTMNDMQCNSHEMADDTGQREAEAAQKFIQDVMRIRGESRAEVLMDVILIILEAVDEEIVLQKPGCKRKIPSPQDDRGRLPALVAELFAKLESSGDGKEKFRFSKKRKLI